MGCRSRFKRVQEWTTMVAVQNILAAALAVNIPVWAVIAYFWVVTALKWATTATVWVVINLLRAAVDDALARIATMQTVAFPACVVTATMWATETDKD